MEKNILNKVEKTILVVGLGRVGLPLLLFLEKKKFNLIGLDSNKKLINNLKFVANVILNINQYQLLKNTNSVMNLCFYMYHTALKTLLI